MSRARNIKPGFFKNELLVELPFEFRLLFVGLWTEADRAGRLEDRPTKLKMALFPADNVDVNAGLQALHDAGFILRYSVGNCQYIQVLAWSKHQNPHCKEARSTIPAPGEHGASMVQVQDEHGCSTADSLIPDSGFSDSSEDQTHTPAPPASPAVSPAASHAIALNRAGFRCTAINPDLLAFAEAGGTVDHLKTIAAWPECAGKPAAYVIRIARRELSEQAKPITGGTNATARKPSAQERIEANVRRGQAGDEFAIEGEAIRLTG